MGCDGWTSGSFLLNNVALDPVIPEPAAIWALALNFHTHVEETGLVTSENFPHIFLRHAGSHVGSGEALMCPDPQVARAYEKVKGQLSSVRVAAIFPRTR